MSGPHKPGLASRLGERRGARRDGRPNHRRPALPAWLAQWPPRLGLRDRVTVATALVLGAGLAVLTLAAYAFLAHQLHADASSILRERADAQLATLTVRDGRLIERAASAGDAVDQQAWLYEGGTATRRPAAPPAVQQAADRLAGVRAPREVRVGEDVRLLAEPVSADATGGRTAAAGGARAGAGAATLVVALSIEPYEHTKHLVAVAMALLDAFVLAIGVLLARRAVGKALQPVADMTRQAGEWSEHDLDRRFDLGPPRDELTALSATLDRLLGRLASSLRREQRFSAEMAHELRTPLAGVRGEAELALLAPDLTPDARAALEQVLRGTDRMQAVIDALLAAARRDAASPWPQAGGGTADAASPWQQARGGTADAGSPWPQAGGGTADVCAAARTALDTMRTVARRSGVAVTLDDGDGVVAAGVAAEQPLVAQALQPLLENAVRHARAAVAVRVRPPAGAAGAVEVAVEDDGAGVPADRLAVIFEPGVSGAGGAGLGLPLARRLARSCGGDVVAEPSSTGGRFVLRLPAAT